MGHGTAASCTSSAVVAAVRSGGIIRFSCGPDPVTIRMNATAKVLNTSARVVLDGGGLVTLSGEGRHRILYMDTCDPAQVWTTSHCQDQASPELVIQNLAFVDGNSTGERFDGGGGGAVFDRGGRLRIVNSTFSGNRCEPDGPDIGGGAVRALSQYDGLPVYVVHSRFTGNVCSNGGALSSIGVSWTVLDSRFSANRAIGAGANPAQPGTPGGGSGGAIYNDGDQMTLAIAGSAFVEQPRQRGRRGDLLRQRRPQRNDGDQPQHARAQPQRPLPDRRPAGDLLPRRPEPDDRRVRPALSASVSPRRAQPRARERADCVGQLDAIRSTTNTSVSSGPMTPPAPRLP